MEKTKTTISRSVLYLINAGILASCISATIPAENSNTAAGRNIDSIGISHRQHRYFLTQRCADVLSWEEISMRNRIVAEKINSVIRREVMKYKLIDEDASSRCNREMDYKQSCSIVYTNHDLVSVYFSSYTYFKGTPHGWREFSTLNFDAHTGRRIHFRDLFDSSYQKVLSLMLSNKLKKLYPAFEDDPEHWTGQFDAPEFRFGTSAVTVLLRGPDYGTAIFELQLEYNEIKPFVNANGPMKTLYSRL